MHRLHLWIGVTAALYAGVIGVTGALVMFRPELQAVAHPSLLPAYDPSIAPAEPDVVIRAIRARFPDGRFTGFEYPQTRRGTFQTYVTDDAGLHTVYSDARTGELRGELPASSWVRTLQQLHFNLLIGREGLALNTGGAVLLVLLGASGVVLWWPGLASWRRGFTVDPRRGWRRVVWDLHRATGIWAVGFVLVVALTGVYFAYPTPVRTAIGGVVTLGSRTPPRSAGAAGAARISPSQVVARARAEVPEGRVARLGLPSGPTGSYTVLLERPGNGLGARDEVTLFVDQYTGEANGRLEPRDRTAGDRLMVWLSLLHMGTFGGAPVRVLWSGLALSLPALGATGLVIWWNRVVRR